MAEIVRGGLVQQAEPGTRTPDPRGATHIHSSADHGAQSWPEETVYGRTFCQFMDADYYSYTEASPTGRPGGCFSTPRITHRIVIIAPMYD